MLARMLSGIDFEPVTSVGSTPVPSQWGVGEFATSMRRVLFVLLCLGFGMFHTNARAQSLTFDTSISGYIVGRGTNTLTTASQVDSWSFDALAGDVISINVDTPTVGLNPYVELRNSANGLLISDEDSGSGYDSSISAFTIVSSGTYSVRVGARSSTGPYVVRVEIGRTVQLESDGDFSNDTIPGANALRKVVDGVQAKASMAGTIMQTGRAGTLDAGNTDEDTFDLGRLNSGNIVEISFRLPTGSTLAPRVTLLSSAGAVIADDDGNATNAHFHATMPAAGS